MPGGRAALPAGTLPKPFFGPQGDEQRHPSAGSPAPVTPAPVVEQEVAPNPGMSVVARLSDLPDNGVVRRRHGETEIVLVRTGQKVRAFGADCPHAGAPLEAGAVCDGRLICPWHKAQFAIADGTLLEPPALDDLTRYPTRIQGGDVLVATEPVSPAPPQPRGGDRVMAIVGTGAAGTAAAVELRRRGFDGRVLLIGAEASGPYDRTALSKFVLAGDMPPAEVPPLRDPAWWSDHAIERVAATVTRIDAAARRILLSDGSAIAYDTALLATGAVATRPDLPGMALRGVHTLRDAHDAVAIVAAAAPDARIVIMGSSFIGLEAASALRKRGLRVTVVAPDEVPFAKRLGPEIGGMFLRLHEANGVVFRLGTTVERIRGAGAVEAVVLRGGEVLPADMLLVGVGVVPATGFVDGVDKAEDGGIVVDASLRAAQDLYAAGDCAAFPFQGEHLRIEHLRIEHWRVAQQHGRLAAAAMLGAGAAYDGVPFFWTYHYGQRVEYIGHARHWDRLHVEGDLDRQDFVALQIRDESVVGIIACQRERLTAMLIERLRAPLPAAEALALLRREAG